MRVSRAEKKNNVTLCWWAHLSVCPPCHASDDPPNTHTLKSTKRPLALERERTLVQIVVGHWLGGWYTVRDTGTPYPWSRVEVCTPCVPGPCTTP